MKRMLLLLVASGPIAAAGCCWRQQQPYAAYPPAPAYAPTYAAPPCQPVQQQHPIRQVCEHVDDLSVGNVRLRADKAQRDDAAEDRGCSADDPSPFTPSPATTTTRPFWIQVESNV